MSAWPIWTNPHIELFHGTTESSAAMIVEHGIDISFGDPSSDFGLGFYTTSLLYQAAEWARKKATESRGDPAIVKVSMDRLILRTLKTLGFVSGELANVDYWSFVYHCRYRLGQRPLTGEYYDVVYGPLALPWPDSIYPGWEQISFHGRDAQSILRDPALCSVEVMQWPIKRKD